MPFTPTCAIIIGGFMPWVDSWIPARESWGFLKAQSHPPNHHLQPPGNQAISCGGVEPLRLTEAIILEGWAPSYQPTPKITGSYGIRHLLGESIAMNHT